MIKLLNRIYLRQLFFPSLISILINPFYFIRKQLLKNIRYYAPKLNGDLLDFGCGSKPYKKLFVNVEKYIGIDIENEGHSHINEDIDVFFDGKNIPFEKNTFNSVLASEVLEHVPDIDDCLSEIWRVLRPEGKLLISIPFVWPEHELPFDFRRFTLTGIEEVLCKNGFEILSYRKSGSFFEVIVQLWMEFLRSSLYTKNKYINLIINTIFVFPACITGIIFSPLFYKKRDIYFSAIILAQKEVV